MLTLDKENTSLNVLKKVYLYFLYMYYSINFVGEKNGIKLLLVNWCLYACQALPRIH